MIAALYNDEIDVAVYVYVTAARVVEMSANPYSLERLQTHSLLVLLEAPTTNWLEASSRHR